MRVSSMTTQENGQRGGRHTLPTRAAARAMPIPSEYEAFRRYRAEYCRKAARRNPRPANDAAPAKPANRAESRFNRALWRVDRLAIGLMPAAVLALWPFAVSLITQ